MIHEADLIAVCEVVRYPCNVIPDTPDDERTHRGVHYGPGFIKVRIIKILFGAESDKDLLVDWVDWSSDRNIKEGNKYIVFLWRRLGKTLFLNAPPEGDRRIPYAGVEINNNYQRFNSEYWIREITDGKIIWTDDRILSIDEFAQLVQAERKQRYRPAKFSVYRFYSRRVLEHLSARSYYITATIFISIGVLFVLLRNKTSKSLAAMMTKTRRTSKPFMLTPAIWAEIGSVWIVAGLALLFM